MQWEYNDLWPQILDDIMHCGGMPKNEYIDVNDNKNLSKRSTDE